MKYNFGAIMFRGESLKAKMRRGTAFIMAAFIAIMGLSVYAYSYYLVNSKYLSEAQSAIKYTEMLFYQTYEDAIRAIDMVQNHHDIATDYASFLNVIYDSVNHVSTVYIGTETGEFYLYPKRFVPSHFDPRVRDWYTHAMDQKDSYVWSEPYVDIGTEELAITISKAMNLSHLNNVVVGVDILLTDINRLVNTVAIGKNGYIILYDSNQRILAHKDDQMINRIDESINDHSLKVNVHGFIISAVIDQKDVNRDFFLLFSILMLFFTGFVFILDRFNITMINDMIDPIVKLKETMVLVKEGDYSVKCDIKRSDEIGFLIDGFNETIKSVLDNSIEMQALYEELYASEETLQDQYDTLFEHKEFIRKSEERYKMIFEASKEGLWEMDANKQLSFLTPNWYTQFSLPDANATYEDWLALVHDEDKDYVKLVFDDHIGNHSDRYLCEYRLLNKENAYIWIESVGKARYNDMGDFIGMSGSHLDITIRKNYELKIYNMAYKDNLTKLYNRSYFEDYLKAFVNSGNTGCILFADINNFKYINDIYGHTVGDDILVTIANRLSHLFADSKKYLLSRFSGDEFIILVKHVEDKELLTFIVAMLTKEIEKPIEGSHSHFKISASIGVTTFPKDGLSSEILLQNADIAMYHAKRVSRKSVYFYDENIKADAVKTMEIENALRHGIENDEFLVHYQPIVDIHTEKMISFEALIRWHSSSLGFIYPNDFISIAERTGLITDIGLIVIEKSCAFLKTINERFNEAFTVSINISAIQLLDEKFTRRVEAILNKYDIPNHLITLEITESMTLDSNEQALRTLFDLKNLNLSIALDDFGTGYSSFENLIRLPLSSIKIDRSIMKDSMSNVHVFKLLESIVEFAHKINIDVVAEGIENEDYVFMSKKIKVDFLQGYLFGKPVSEEEIIERLNKKGG